MSIRISIKVQPGAGRNEVVGQVNGFWKIRVSAAADKGKANKELVDFLSDRLDLKKTQIMIVSGLTSHHKVLQIEGLTEADLVIRFSASR
jgi:uncharacterized protein